MPKNMSRNMRRNKPGKKCDSTEKTTLIPGSIESVSNEVVGDDALPVLSRVVTTGDTAIIRESRLKYRLAKLTSGSQKLLSTFSETAFSETDGDITARAIGPSSERSSQQPTPGTSPVGNTLEESNRPDYQASFVLNKRPGANDSQMQEFELSPDMESLLDKVIDEHIQQYSDQLRQRLYRELRASVQAEFDQLSGDAVTTEVNYVDGQDIQPQSH